jgi:hypothetical protein
LNNVNGFYAEEKQRDSFGGTAAVGNSEPPGKGKAADF